MRHIIVFSLFVTITFFVGALLAYPLKLLFDPVLDLAFRKYLTYATLMSGLIISCLYLKTYQLLSLKAFGYSGGTGKFFKRMANGFIYGILIILIIEVLLLLLGIHEIDSTRHYRFDTILLLLLKATLAGVLISLLEESIFRGALFTGLYEKTGAVITVFFSSMVYAAVHFIRYPDLPPYTDIDWITGLTMMPEAFGRLGKLGILDYFLTLFIFGVLLGLLRLRHNNIAACIGLHAGTVMLIKTTKYFTNRTHNSNFEYLINQYNSTFGWISFMVILLCSIFYFTKLNSR